MCVQATILWLFVTAAPGNQCSPQRDGGTPRASVTLHPLKLALWPLITPPASLANYTVSIFLGSLKGRRHCKPSFLLGLLQGPAKRSSRNPGGDLGQMVMETPSL